MSSSSTRTGEQIVSVESNNPDYRVDTWTVNGKQTRTLDPSQNNNIIINSSYQRESSNSSITKPSYTITIGNQKQIVQNDDGKIQRSYFEAEATYQRTLQEVNDAYNTTHGLVAKYYIISDGEEPQNLFDQFLNQSVNDTMVDLVKNGITKYLMDENTADAQQKVKDVMEEVENSQDELADQMANLKERIALKLTDDSESRTLVGRHQHIMEDIPGRGLIKRDDIEVLQVALSTEGTETFDIINNIQNESDAMNSKWTGPRPKAIPIVPEELTFDDFMATDSVQADLSANRLPLGLEMVDVESYSLALNRFKHMLYMSDSDESLEAVGSHIIKVLLNVPNYHTMIIDSLGEYESYQGQVRTYVGSDMIEDMADQLIYELQQRESQSEIAEWFIMIPDFESFVAKSNMKLEQVQALLDNGPRYGLHLILGSSYNYVGTKIDAVPKYVRTTTQYVLAGMRLMDQTFLEKVYNSKEIRPNKDEAYIHDRKTYQKLKLTID